MGMKSKRKGRKFEQVIADRLREVLPGINVRRSMQGDRAHEPDVVIDAPRELPLLRMLWHELTDGAAPDPTAKMEQAQRDIERVLDQRIPVVIWHKKGQRTIQATMTLIDLLDLNMMVWGGTERTATGVMRSALVTFDFEVYLGAIKRYFLRIAASSIVEKANANS